MSIGVWSVSFVNISPTVPPATEANAAPAIPSRNLATSIVCIFVATAHGIRKTRKSGREARYIFLRP